MNKPETIDDVVKAFNNKGVELKDILGIRHVRIPFGNSPSGEGLNHPDASMLEYSKIRRASNLRLSIECVQYCRQNPNLLGTLGKKKLASSVAYHSGDIIGYAREEKQIPNINGAKGNTMHSVIADVLRNVYRITVPKFDPVEHHKEEKARYKANERVLAHA